MAGASIRVTLEDGATKRSINLAVARSLNLEPAFEEFGSYEVASTQHRIEQEVDPDGERWPELALSTQMKRVGRGGQRRGADHMLRQRGYLFGSITYLASRFEVAIGANRPYAALQQFGGEPDMPPGPAAVPARPFLGLSDDDADELGHILLDYVGGPFT